MLNFNSLTVLLRALDLKNHFISSGFAGSRWIYLFIAIFAIFNLTPPPASTEDCCRYNTRSTGGGVLYIDKKMVFIKSSVKLKLELKNFQIWVFNIFFSKSKSWSILWHKIDIWTYFCEKKNFRPSWSHWKNVLIKKWWKRTFNISLSNFKF